MGRSAMDVAFRQLAETRRRDQAERRPHEDFVALSAARETADTDISRWAAKVDDAWMAEDLVWFSGAAGQETGDTDLFLLVPEPL